MCEKTRIVSSFLPVDTLSQILSAVETLVASPPRHTGTAELPIVLGEPGGSGRETLCAFGPRWPPTALCPWLQVYIASRCSGLSGAEV